MGIKLSVGFDVSKDSFDLAISPQKDLITFTNDQNGVHPLVKN
jgi:transposase